VGGRSILLGLLDERTKSELRREAVRSYLEDGFYEINKELRQADPLASLAGHTLALNIVTDKNGSVSKIFAGDLDESFNKAARHIDEVYRIELEKAPDHDHRPRGQTIRLYIVTFSGFDHVEHESPQERRGNSIGC
jgi:hypothetical protein